MNWNVLHVRPRCEKKIGEYCSFHQIEFYLPLRDETKIYQRRKVTVSKPVFPGYVFASFSCDRRELLLKSGNLARIIDVIDQDNFLWELDQVRKALFVDPTLGAMKALQKGMLVRIVNGPFLGLEGLVDSVKTQSRVMLNVNMIGQGVFVDVEADMLELLD
jgi:transcriptional antiterminator RfaH